MVPYSHNWKWSNLGEVLEPSGVACKRTKAKQEELGSSLSVDELAKGDVVDVAIPSWPFKSLHRFPHR